MPFPIEGRIQDLEDRRSFIKFWSFDPPAGISVEPQYEHQQVHGRWAPHRFYTGTGPETWEIALYLRASLEEGDKRTHQDVWKEHLFLKSLAFPDYGRNKRGPVKPPHRVLITWGLSIRMQGVVKTPRFTWILPYDEDGYPMGIDVTFSFEVDQSDGKTPFDQSDVRRQAEMVGLGMNLERSGT